ncbi:hypothetical protein ACHQM5_008074 [Ranunculus cassubicifolius]
MLLETFPSSSNALNNFNMYENVCSSSTPFKSSIEQNTGITHYPLSNVGGFDDLRPPLDLRTAALDHSSSSTPLRKSIDEASNTTITSRSRKRSRRPRVCKNKEEAETQRMTHITVERNRRKQMNEYLAVLRSLMPESYTHRGDQASIVGGAIEYVKELEQLLQSLEAEKRLLKQKEQETSEHESSTTNLFPPPFSQFFTCPQFSWCQVPGDNPSENRTSIADIEVTLIESHANIKILARRRPQQLFKMVAGFQTLLLTILHLNVTTLDPLVFYCLSVKVEEGCHLNSVDDIANAVHHMLRIIEDEAAVSALV